jgi:glycosyltransferase involved in cell wall biosynthesis
MRIGIDGACWSNRRGYGRFLRELLRAVLVRRPEHRFILFIDTGVDPKDPELAALASDSLEVVGVATSAGAGEAATVSNHRSVADLLRMSRAVARTPYDVFFFPSVFSYFPILTRVPILLGIHDTMADRHPEFAFASGRQRLFWRAKVRLALMQSRMVLTVSEYSRRSIQQTLGVAAEKIRVVHEAPAAMFVPAEDPPEPFVLYAGGISPNKNLVRLVNAFAFCAPLFPDYKLLLAGDCDSDGFKSSVEEVRAAVLRNGLGDRVVFTGFVPDEELKRLYQRTSVFAFPSLDEGFGLPPLEAMACGAPVVASKGSALSEVIGDAGVLVEPTDEAAIAAALQSVLSDANRARDLRARSLQRAAEFSWDRAAQRFLSICEETAGVRP